LSNHIFTSESVTEGHPDKVADQISDAVLDKCLKEDPQSRVACETLVTTGLVVVTGEITTNSDFIDIEGLVRGTLKNIGYDRSSAGMHGGECGVLPLIGKQSKDIAMGVDREGAGDQGMMFGYATDETEQFMPAPIFYAHGLVRRLAEIRHDGVLPWLKPDGKAQVSIRYEDGVPSSVDAIVVSAQHDKLIDGDDDSSINKEHRMIKDRIISEVIEKVIPLEWLHGLDANKIHVNPTKRFVTGGPEGDAGLTGRKIIVDTYGGMGRHGGGAFSGKDATKVDRSGAYAARWAARSLVEAGAAKRCEIQLAYAIGVKEPVSVYVNNFETGKFTNNELERIVKDVFDFKPESIIRDLNLRKAIFFPTSTYGHFGRKSVTKVLDTGESVDLFPWESSGKVQDIQTALKM